MNVNTDCRQFRTATPCTFHKKTGVTCGSCTVYDPVTWRVVIVKLGAPGDVLRSTCLLAPLHRAIPGCHVTWITRSDAAALLTHNPLIDRVMVIEGNYLEVLLTEHFDLVLGPDADPLSASIVSLVRAPEKRGYCSDGRGSVTALSVAAAAWLRLGIDDGAKRAARDTYGTWLYRICGLAGEVATPGFSVSRSAAAGAALFLATHARGFTRCVLVNTGASTRWAEKRWKPRHIIEFGERLRRADPDTAVLLVGGPCETEFNTAILARTDAFVDARTDWSYDELGALIAAVDWVLTPDSLAYHMACAVGTAAVCLVGPTAPWELDRYERNLVLHDARACIACYRTSCLFDLSCMDTLPAAAVLRTIDEHQLSSSTPLRFRSGVVAVGGRPLSGDTTAASPPDGDPPALPWNARPAPERHHA